MAKLIDMRGQTVARLFVYDRATNNRWGQTRWHCLCIKCGNERIVVGNNLRNGNTKSCGCLQREIITAQQKRSFMHGHNRRGKTTKVYFKWKNWRNRKKTDLPFPEFLRQQEESYAFRKSRLVAA